MRLIYYSLALSMCILTTSCQQKRSIEKSDTTEDSAVPAVVANDFNSVMNNPTSEIFVYEGTLPCADCKGVKTTLKLTYGDGTMEQHRFELTRVYEGKSEKSIVIKGNFNDERGFEKDIDATVFILNWDKNEMEQEYFVRYSSEPNIVYQLDKNKQRIKSKLNYALIKK